MIKPKFTKNFLWWIITVISLVAMIIHLILESYFVAGIMLINFIISSFAYYKTKIKGV